MAKKAVYYLGQADKYGSTPCSSSWKHPVEFSSVLGLIFLYCLNKYVQDIFLQNLGIYTKKKKWFLGCCLAQLVEQRPMYTGFVLTAAVLGSTPSPGPFAVCHSPSSCFLSESSAILSIKPKDQTKEIMPTFKIIVFASFHIQRKEPTQLNPHSYSGWWNLSSGWSCCCTGWYEFPRLHTMTKGLLTPTCISVQLSSHFDLKKTTWFWGCEKVSSQKCPENVPMSH